MTLSRGASIVSLKGKGDEEIEEMSELSRSPQQKPGKEPGSPLFVNEKGPMKLTAAALGKLPKKQRSRKESAAALSMINVIKKIRHERAKLRQDMRRGQFTVLQKSAEDNTHLENAMRSILLQPDDYWRMLWDCVILVCIIYYWIWVPIQYVVEPEDMLLGPAHVVIEIILSCILIADLLLRFCTCVVDNGSLYDSVSMVSEFYLHHGFTWDFLAALPMDLLILWLAGRDYYGGWVFTLASHMRLLKIFRFKSLFQIMNSLKLDQRVVNFHFGIVPNLKMAFHCIMSIHIITVVFMLMNKDDKWADDDFGYTTSLYWTLYTVSSVGYGDVPVNTPWKRRFASLLCVVGVIFHGIVISEISSRMSKGDVSSERRDKMKATLNIMDVFDVPEELQKEVFAFQYHQLHSSNGGQLLRVLDSLPGSMKNRVGLYVRVKFICKVGMFAAQTINCLVELANGLRNVVFEPDQVIIQAGDEGAEMYFLAHGYCDVYSPTGQHWGTIRSGGFFGEMALFSNAKRNATIKALTYCDLFVLQKDKFLVIMDKYHDLQRAVQKEAEKRGAKTDTKTDDAADANAGDSAATEEREEKEEGKEEQKLQPGQQTETTSSNEDQKDLSFGNGEGPGLSSIAEELLSPGSDQNFSKRRSSYALSDLNDQLLSMPREDATTGSGRLRSPSMSDVPIIQMTPPVPDPTPITVSSMNASFPPRNAKSDARLTVLEQKVDQLIEATGRIETLLTGIGVGEGFEIRRKQSLRLPPAIRKHDETEGAAPPSVSEKVEKRVVVNSPQTKGTLSPVATTVSVGSDSPSGSGVRRVPPPLPPMPSSMPSLGTLREIHATTVDPDHQLESPTHSKPYEGMPPRSPFTDASPPPSPPELMETMAQSNEFPLAKGNSSVLETP
eukprot:TRINITY_DN1132_c0_g3_i3.p1 TRINITY_DN1132_c0_g3~~TRINITY_DN1132_c0_g3_i3.p1  ORF type:complete len:895 (+),score=172.55 TRINITY_DN1132_c0_g3_i3:2585-5269(+)